ncbi:hypothetical protein ACFQFC_02750 [Amorphoplanes digitatis]|uniref:Uncharacterized protein n=1 Tax=Actinoplanes digitatis TaxID=1868 RepID=A0A7W7HYH5_9ACTN|nr:hypothetical protein [Actinoplanes digitatis]MBB4763096.1 hypothetical protein [Actinoplanes digitatis]GID97183.1 hypothetical protein Adi01nite_65950 [Actinoplanes digitatis]
MTTHKDPVTTTGAAAVTSRPPLEFLAGQCTGGTCPAVYRRDAHSVVVQGYALTGNAAGVDLPDGEHLVEIPVDVLLAAADKIRNQG